MDSLSQKILQEASSNITLLTTTSNTIPCSDESVTSENVNGASWKEALDIATFALQLPSALTDETCPAFTQALQTATAATDKTHNPLVVQLVIKEWRQEKILQVNEGCITFTPPEGGQLTARQNLKGIVQAHADKLEAGSDAKTLFSITLALGDPLSKEELEVAAKPPLTDTHAPLQVLESAGILANGTDLHFVYPFFASLGRECADLLPANNMREHIEQNIRKKGLGEQGPFTFSRYLNVCAVLGLTTQMQVINATLTKTRELMSEGHALTVMDISDQFLKSMDKIDYAQTPLDDLKRIFYMQLRSLQAKSILGDHDVNEELDQAEEFIKKTEAAHSCSLTEERFWLTNRRCQFLHRNQNIQEQQRIVGTLKTLQKNLGTQSETQRRSQTVTLRECENLYRLARVGKKKTKQERIRKAIQKLSTPFETGATLSFIEIERQRQLLQCQGEQLLSLTSRPSPQALQTYTESVNAFLTATGESPQQGNMEADLQLQLFLALAHFERYNRVLSPDENDLNQALKTWAEIEKTATENGYIDAALKAQNYLTHNCNELSKKSAETPEQSSNWFTQAWNSYQRSEAIAVKLQTEEPVAVQLLLIRLTAFECLHEELSKIPQENTGRRLPLLLSMEKVWESIQQMQTNFPASTTKYSSFIERKKTFMQAHTQELADYSLQARVA